MVLVLLGNQRALWACALMGVLRLYRRVRSPTLSIVGIKSKDYYSSFYTEIKEISRDFHV